MVKRVMNQPTPDPSQEGNYRRTRSDLLPSSEGLGVGSRTRNKESGALITELMVAMAIIVIALFPLAFSFAQEAKFLRSCYNRAVATEIVDGEVEVLLAGEWRAFKEGAQDYAPHALAVTNLTSGKFQLTITNRRVRLEWLPLEKDQGGKVVREVTVK